MKKFLAVVLLSAAAVVPAQAADDPMTVDITVDAATSKGPLKPIWRYCGYDEPNYTYSPDGKKLIRQFSESFQQPAAFRVHSLLVTGDGKGALKWGSTNAYTEDAQGNPVYDWTIVDRIFDTYIEAHAVPLVQIGFMPQALSPKPEPYQHHWKPGDKYDDIYLGWAYPPKDYDKWHELVYQWAKHCGEKYGKDQAEKWFWELWNEPDIGYWKGKPQDYQKLYDYSVDAVKKALPGARAGGPEATGGTGGQRFAKAFYEHVTKGTNYKTGQTGSPIDLLSFHAKGSPQNVNGRVRMGISSQLNNIDGHFGLIASYPTLKQLPIIIGESDPDGCAACSSALYKQNGYRNGTLYAVYTAEQFTRTLDLVDKHGVNLEGAVTWAFEMDDQPFFGGFRVLATNGIELPVLNTFRMLGKMTGNRLAVTSTGDLGVEEIRANGVRKAADVYALAARDGNTLTILSFNYHDDDVSGPVAQVALAVKGLPEGLPKVRRTEWRIDQSHSNAYTAWQAMGEPAKPTPQQYAELEKAAKLALFNEPSDVLAEKGKVTIPLALDRQAVSLIQLTW